MSGQTLKKPRDLSACDREECGCGEGGDMYALCMWGISPGFTFNFVFPPFSHKILKQRSDPSPHRSQVANNTHYYLSQTPVVDVIFNVSGSEDSHYGTYHQP